MINRMEIWIMSASQRGRTGEKMAKANTWLAQFIEEEIRKYGGVMVPVKASVLERAIIRNVTAGKLHPNPDDEFCVPSIGPNYGIIANYESIFRRYGSMHTKLNDEPLMVQKVHPDGYMILNGHHRWVAAMQSEIKWIPISIINLTQETDIENMLRASNHDKRVTLDLDEVVFAVGEGMPAEKPLHFPVNKIYKERIRLGIPALLHYLGKEGYDIWVYTAKYYSYDYISAYFRRYSVKVDGVITGTVRKTKAGSEAKKRTEQLFAAKYVETLHIDNDMVLRTFRDSREHEEYVLEDTGIGWSKAVMEVVKGFKKTVRRI